MVDSLDVMKHTPLFRACEMGHRNVILTLIKGECSLTYVSYTFSVISGKSYFLFQFSCGLCSHANVLNKGSARVDLVDVDGHTALHWAALGGNAEVCQILMENGISPNVQVCINIFH